MANFISDDSSNGDDDNLLRRSRKVGRQRKQARSAIGISALELAIDSDKRDSSISDEDLRKTIPTPILDRKLGESTDNSNGTTPGEPKV